MGVKRIGGTTRMGRLDRYLFFLENNAVDLYHHIRMHHNGYMTREHHAELKRRIQQRRINSQEPVDFLEDIC
jgi:hypothetical protein